MSLHFATCNRGRALEYLRRIMADEAMQDAGDVAELLDLVEQDVVRIQDPMMHTPAGIVGSTNWQPAYMAQVEMIAGRLAEKANATKTTE